MIEMYRYIDNIEHLLLNVQIKITMFDKINEHTEKQINLTINKKLKV